MSPPNTILGERRSYADVADTHDHPFAQLILPLSGTLFIETARHRLAVDTARLFFLPPHCLHTFYANDTNQFLVLDVPPQAIPTPDRQRLDGGVSPALDERWQALRLLLLSEIGEQPATHRALTDLFRYAYELLHREARPRSLQYIHAHYADPLDLPTLAALEGFTPTYYSEWFKKLTGLTPTAYIQQMRLTAAKQLLAQTDLPILHIAQQVGYEHHASLTRLFRQVEGLTPHAFRHKSRNLVK